MKTFFLFLSLVSSSIAFGGELETELDSITPHQKYSIEKQAYTTNPPEIMKSIFGEYECSRLQVLLSPFIGLSSCSAEYDIRKAHQAILYARYILEKKGFLRFESEYPKLMEELALEIYEVEKL